MSPASMVDRINDLVHVGNRIITYKAVSQELKIHVNAAKKYLTDYCNAQKALGIELEINYFLAGFVEVNGLRSVRVLVVSADHVDESKMCFAELTSCHIYSVLRGFSKNEHALYSADYSYTQNIEDLNKYSAIQHPNIELKPPILTKMPPIMDVKMSCSKKIDLNTVSNGKTKVDSKTSANSETVSNKDTVTLDKAEKDSKEKPDPGAKSGSLVSMWQKKENSNAEKSGTKPDPKTKQASKSVPKNNIMSMFSKQAEKNLVKPPSKPESKDIPVSDLPVSKPSNQEPANEVKKSSQKRKISSKKSNASKLQQNSDSENESKLKPKKHRRICTFDSDSESEAEEEKEKAQRSFFLPEEPMETSVATPASDDGEEPIPPTPPIIKVKGKSKIWKTIQKTYEDDDGFFVTKTEKELVSASEDEEDPIRTEKKDSKPDKKEVKEKKSPTKQNKKQASLMSFFKQK